MSSNYLSIIQSLGLPKPDPRMVMVYNAPPSQAKTNEGKSNTDSFSKGKSKPASAKTPPPKISPETKEDMQKKLRNGEPVDMYVVLKGVPKAKMKNADLVESMEMKTYRVNPDTIVVHNRIIPKNAKSQDESTKADE